MKRKIWLFLLVIGFLVTLGATSIASSTLLEQCLAKTIRDPVTGNCTLGYFDKQKRESLELLKVIGDPKIEWEFSVMNGPKKLGMIIQKAKNGRCAMFIIKIDTLNLNERGMLVAAGYIIHHKFLTEAQALAVLTPFLKLLVTSELSSFETGRQAWENWNRRML